MIKNIKTVTDKGLFNQLLHDYFMNHTSYVKSNNGNIQVKFLNCSGGLAAVRIPMNVKPPKNSLMFARHENNIVFAFMKFWEARNADTFIFNPVKFQIVTAERKDQRKQIESADENKNLIYVTNVISDYLILNSLTEKIEKIEKIRERVRYDNEHDYDYLKLYFTSDGNSDPRMKFFHKKREPIFIPDFKSRHDADDRELIEYYFNNIYSKESDLIETSNLVSEISVPFLYETKIPYGYIQVNNSSPFTKSSLAGVKRISLLIEQLGIDYKLFNVLEDRLLVSDVSSKGLGIVFKDKKYIPCYQENSYVSLDVMLPKSKKASMLTDVRHLEILENKYIKVGFEIKDMDRDSISNYEGFLKSISDAA